MKGFGAFGGNRPFQQFQQRVQRQQQQYRKQQMGGWAVLQKKRQEAEQARLRAQQATARDSMTPTIKPSLNLRGLVRPVNQPVTPVQTGGEQQSKSVSSTATDTSTSAIIFGLVFWIVVIAGIIFVLSLIF